jgi:uncharacterized lipoprotein YmbA
MKSFFIIICTVWMFVGCGSTYPTFYTLSAEGPSPSGGGVAIGVGPVILAEYVNRSNLVVKTSANKMEIAKDHRWAGDLDYSISRVLSINLGRKLKTGNVRTYPWSRDSEVDYQVAMDIREFLKQAGGFTLCRVGVWWSRKRSLEKNPSLQVISRRWSRRSQNC